MTEITIRTVEARESRVLVGARLRSVGLLAREATVGRRALLVTDRTVARLYGVPALASLARAGFRADLVALPPGERSKTLAAAGRVCARASRLGLSRQDAIVALGGGVVSDLAGFAASVYLRGIAFIAVPTTLLAQVDAAVGGKTGVDLPWGKNLVGSFHQPRLVVADVRTLATLPAREFRQGMAEVIKYGMIGDARLFASLERVTAAAVKRRLPDIVARCVGAKAAVVEEDAREETGRREILNFGHTLGHALEIAHLPRYTHGEAVALGMAGETWLAVRRGICRPGVLDRLLAVLRKHGLPWNVGACGWQAALPRLKYDKKTRDGRVRFVVPVRIGAVRTGEIADAASVARILREWPL